jgi:hypothetical protein
MVDDVYLEEFNGVPYVTDQSHSDQENDFFGEEEGWWDDPMTRYRYGECHALALALCRERPGWTLAAFDDWSHVLALTPEGVAVDVEGAHDIEELYRWSDGWPGEHELLPVDWEDLTAYIGTGYSHPTVDEFTREVARDVLSEHGL